MLVTNIFAHTIEVNFNLIEGEKEKDSLIDEESIKQQLKDGLTSFIGIEIISGEDPIGHMSWSIRRDAPPVIKDNEKTIELLGHTVAYRFEEGYDEKIGECTEEKITNDIIRGCWEGEICDTDINNQEKDHYGWWRSA